MKYEQIPIPPALETFIQSIWKLEDDEHRRDHFQSFQLIADSSPGLIFQHADFGNFFREGKQLPAAFVFGPSTKFGTLQLEGSFKAMGIFFYPDALKTVFGLKAEQLTDTCMDIDTMTHVKSRSLVEKLLNAESIEDRLNLMLSALQKLRADHESNIDVNVSFAISEILASHGRLSLRELSKNMNLSERTIERKFRENIGITPKLFSRLCQFQSSLRYLKSQNHHKLSDVAFEFEFSDQSHFIRTFKEFSGFTPNNFIRRSKELVDNLAQPVR
ncbi:helix-turn-helix transcriptional regulator [Fulvivirga sp. 29W222]|uniref:Helix-turn-helix transcriptional regulator n=1 Tax=Fulvivirga marina TaxID=2494733 RepID=A0A937G039_9BACT|nr:AraC family transcriptional regulator [Fulvivirga marina]MBL6449349.1 helix-turn-helix transcriptional regulator [Fulvivirga marina]